MELGAAGDRNLFKTGGLLPFIGAIATIDFGPGASVMRIGEIMQSVGFFAAPEHGEQAPAA